MVKVEVAAPQDALPPDEPLYRIGWPPDPLMWPEQIHIGRNRFDDPERMYGVLYLAEQRVACFIELLAFYRKDPRLEDVLTQLPEGDPGDFVPQSGIIKPGFRQRPVGAVRVSQGQRFLDLRSMDTRTALYGLMFEELDAIGRGDADMDLGDVLSRHRPLTQAISRWARQEGYQGIAYKSRFHITYDCWALFEGAQFEPLVSGYSDIQPTDSDLQRVIEMFDLRLG